MKVRFVIADDEKPARDELRCLLAEVPDAEVAGEAATGREALAAVEALRPDVLLLDIQMPGLTGLQVAEALRGRPGAPLVVFVTAYDEHALAAFDREAVDYLLKPPNPERFRRCVARVRGFLADPQARAEARARTEAAAARLAGAAAAAARRILGLRPAGKGQVVLNPAEIDYFEARGDNCYAVRGGEEFAVRATLSALEQDLEGTAFFRTHRTYLVNLDRVEELVPWFSGTWRVKLKGARGQDGLPVSRAAMKVLRERPGWGRAGGGQ